MGARSRWRARLSRLAVAAACLLGILASPQAKIPEGASVQPVLLVVLDDVGNEMLEVGRTPYLEWLKGQAVVYDRFVAAPNCSNARAKFESGFYSIRSRNLIGSIFKNTSTGALTVGPHLLAQRIPNAAQVGKWHLCEDADYTHRVAAGYVSSGGSQANLNPGDYFDWEAVVDGTALQVTEYATTWTTTRAIEEIVEGRQLVSVSYNAAHKPIHVPPGYSESSAQAMLEALDAQLSVLIPYARLHGYAVVILSDNGGTAQDGGKGNLSHKALATFLACYGFDRPLQARAVVDMTDIHATLVDAATGGPPMDCDGVSLLDPSDSRFAAFADKFKGQNTPPRDDWEEMATDGITKVIRKPSTGEITVTDWWDAPSSEDPQALLAALDAR